MGFFSNLFGNEKKSGQAVVATQDNSVGKSSSPFTEAELETLLRKMEDAYKLFRDPSFDSSSLWWWPPGFSPMKVFSPNKMMGLYNLSEEDAYQQLMKVWDNQGEYAYFTDKCGYRLSSYVYMHICKPDDLEKYDNFISNVTSLDPSDALELAKDKGVLL